MCHVPVGISRTFFCRGSRPFRGLVFPVRIFYLCRMTTELCAYSVEACEAARRAGVTRVELCASPYEGGTTPSAAAIRMARRIGGLQLSVMVRPRGGDFLYSDTEFRQMLEEVRFARECGADGVVFGVLTPDGRVDVQRTAALVAEAGPMQTTFHRAFDMACDLEEALEAAVAAGCRRILTSGGRNTAVEGIDTLRQHLECAAAGGHGRRCRAFQRPQRASGRHGFPQPACFDGRLRRCFRIRSSLCRRTAHPTNTYPARTMKRIIFLLLGACLCACGRYGCGVPAGYEPLLDAALAGCPRADSLRQLLRQTPREQREGMAFLIAHMPRGDRDTMRLDLLRENVEYAYRARREYPWTRALPDSVFLNEVLPYAAVDEVRDSWRADFYPRFARRVALCRDIRAAIDSVNRNIAADVGVEYNTAREKTNQSPAESMRQHMASCTGLSVLLVDALRAAGIPARFAGTPAWHDDRGNHSWVEVWIGGRWYFTEYYPSGLDHAWFLSDAGRALDDRTHGIFAVSFRPTGDWFPMVWSEDSREVHGVDVSQRYRDLYASYEQALVAQGRHTTVTFVMYDSAAHEGRSDARVAANVDVFCGAEQMGGGRTAGPRQDMNDALRFLLEKGKSYTFRYENARGETTEVTAEVGDAPLTVTGYMR